MMLSRLCAIGLLISLVLTMEGCSRSTESDPVIRKDSQKPNKESASTEVSPPTPDSVTFVSSHPSTPGIFEFGQRVLSESKLDESNDRGRKALALAEFLAKDRSERPSPAPEIPVWTILLDDSQTMLIPDETDGRTRWEAALHEWQCIAPQLKVLESEGRLVLKVGRFSNSSRGFRELNPEGPPEGISTSLLEAIEMWSKETKPASSGLLLMTDGIHSASADMMENVLSRTRGSSYPICVMAMGNPDSNAPDTFVRELLVDPSVMRNSKIKASVEIGIRNLVGKNVTVRLMGQPIGSDEEPTLLNSVETIVRNPDEILKLQFPDFPAPKSFPDWLLTANILPLESELTVQNNSSSRVMCIRNFPSVLLLAGSDSLEGQAITQAMEEATGISLSMLQLKSEDSQDVSDWNRSAVDSLAGSEFDVVVLCDLQSRTFSPELWKSLLTVVRQGVGLLLCGGEKTYAAPNWSDTWLRTVLPVRLHSVSRPISTEFHISPTHQGLSSVFRLSSDLAISREKWSSLGFRHSGQQFEDLRGPATIMAEDEHGKTPILVVHDIERSKVAVLAIGDTVQWRTSANASSDSMGAHRRFWKQLLHYLARFEEPDVWTYMESGYDSIQIEAGVTEDLKSSEGLNATATLFDPDGKENRIALQQYELGKFQANTSVQSPGIFRAQVEVQSDRLSLYPATSFVFHAGRNYHETLPNHAILRDLAQQTQGIRLQTSQSKEFLEFIEQAIPPVVARTSEFLELFITTRCEGTSEQFAYGLASLLQSQSIHSRINRGDHLASPGVLIDVPLENGTVLSIDPVTGLKAD